MAVFLGGAMLDDILFCINAILPIFILMVLGYFLMRIKLINETFVNVADKFVFKVALPAMIFNNVANSNFSTDFNPRLSAFVLVAIFACFIVITAIASASIKKRDVRGAFVQAVFRSNFAILGLPVAGNLFGEAGTVGATLLFPFVIPLYNVLAVITLATNMPANEKKSKLSYACSVVKSIVTNPLNISVVLGLPFAFSLLNMPSVIDSGIHYLSDLSTPLALISLGASFKFSSLKGNIGYALGATLTKLLAVPITVRGLGILCGFRGVDLGLLLIVFGTPTAVSSYIMAKEMKSNGALAGQIVMLSTLLCSVTLLVGTFLLKNLGLI